MVTLVSTESKLRFYPKGKKTNKHELAANLKVLPLCRLQTVFNFSYFISVFNLNLLYWLLVVQLLRRMSSVNIINKA